MKRGIQWGSSYGIIRNNVFINNGEGLNIESWPNSPVSIENRIYSNTFYNNLLYGLYLIGTNDLYNNIFKNNILYKNNIKGEYYESN